MNAPFGPLSDVSARLWVVAFVLAGCPDAADRDAKRRILSSAPELPLAARMAQSPIEAHKLAEDPVLLRRVLHLTALEAAERLGPFKLEAQVSFDWQRGPELVKLSEDHLVLVRPGGDYHVRVNNDRQQGMELIRAGGTTYGRSRFGRYRVRARDQGRGEEALDDAFGLLRTFDEMVNGRLRLSRPTAAEHLSRRAVRYEAGLGSATPSVADPAVPPVQYAKDGPTEATALRLKFAERKEPRVVSGEVWIDEATGVPLKAELVGRISAPGEGQSEAKLALRIRFAVVAQGDSVVVVAPKSPLPDEPKPAGVAAALARFGLAPGPDGGMTPPATDEGE